MQIFLSYAHKDWAPRPKSMSLFIECLKSHLSATIENQSVSIWKDNERMEEFQPWRNQIGDAINNSSGMLILFSSNWLESEVCWQEYKTAMITPEIGRSRIFPLILEPMDLCKANVPAAYVEECKGVIKDFRNDWSESHQKKFGCGYKEEIEKLFGRVESDEYEQNRFLEPLTKRMKKLIEAPTFLTQRTLPIYKASQPKIYSFQLGKIDNRFVEVPAGEYVCGKTGLKRTIRTGFKIMCEALPLSAIFGGNLSSEITYEQLVIGRRGRFRLPHGYELPSEDQWEWAMAGADPETANMWGGGGAAFDARGNRLGIQINDRIHDEPTRSCYDRNRREDTLAKRRENLVGKRLSSNGFTRRMLRYGQSFEGTPIRLIKLGN